MRIEDCFLLGRILKAHSLRGECKVYLDVDYIEDYEEMESVYVLQGNKLTPFFVESFRATSPSMAVMGFRNVNDRTAAEELQGLELYLPLSELPQLTDEQFYFHEIKDFTIVDAELGPLGTVRRVEEFPAQPVIVMAYQNREVLIPIAGNIVGKIDRENKTLATQLPPGLLDIYLGVAQEDDDDEEE